MDGKVNVWCDPADPFRMIVEIEDDGITIKIEAHALESRLLGFSYEEIKAECIRRVEETMQTFDRIFQPIGGLDQEAMSIQEIKER